MSATGQRLKTLFQLLLEQTALRKEHTGQGIPDRKRPQDKDN
jgi:hypothetical protein